MRVLLLSQTFYPDIASVGQITCDLAGYLVREGHQVVVISSRSQYGQRSATLPRQESVDGIEIHRVGLSLFGKSSITLRILDFGLFYLSAAIKTFTIPRPNVIITLTIPPFIALIGYLMKIFKGTGFVYWVMDLYPDVPVACGIMKPDSPVTRFFETINRFCLNKSDRSVVLGRCMKQRITAKGIPAERIEHISVWSDSRVVTPVDRHRNRYRKQWKLKDAFVVMYSGNFGLGHDVQTMCEAARILSGRDDIRFIFIGEGKRKPEVEEFAASHRLGNVQIHSYQPRELLSESLSLGDLHLISLKEQVLGTMVPSKLYGIMAAARPAVFIGNPDSEIGRVLSENDCGLTVCCGDSDALSGLIEVLAGDPGRCQEMGKRARQTLKELYDCQHACAAWERLLIQVAT